MTSRVPRQEYRTLRSTRQAPRCVALASVAALLTVWPGDVVAGLAFEHAAYQVDLDPATGAVSVVMTVTVRADDVPESAVSMIIDSGLSATGAAVDGVLVTPQETTSPPYRVLTVPLALDVGTIAEVTISYAGIPECDTYAPGFAFCEPIPGGMSRYQSGAILPIFIEPDGSATTDIGTQDMVLRLPSGSEVVSNLDVVSDADDGATRTSTLTISDPRAMFAILLAGTFDIDPLSAAPPASEVVYADGVPPWIDAARDEGAALVAFVAHLNGRPFPCQTLRYVELQPAHRDVSAAYRCLLLLNEEDVPEGWRFEEFLAHELSHQFWGIALAPADSLRTRLLHDGAAQLAMYEWGHQRRHAVVDRDEYLGYRQREADIMLRYLAPAAAATPTLVADESDAINVNEDGALEAWGWEYLKSSATHDAVRVVVGQQAYSTAVAAFLEACVGSSCDSLDFRAALEAESGVDLAALFDAWVTGTYYPSLRVGFTVTEGPSGFTALVSLTQAEARSIPVELWVDLETGERRRVLVELTERVTEVHIELDALPVAVRPNPRMTPLLRDASATPGDITFDGRVDGSDVLRCSFALGRRAEVAVSYPPGEEEHLGVFGVDLFFEPRCDLDGDAAVTDADLAVLISAAEGT